MLRQKWPKPFSPNDRRHKRVFDFMHIDAMNVTSFRLRRATFVMAKVAKTTFARRPSAQAPIPCASRTHWAGPNSAIHGLEQLGLVPNAFCDARRSLWRGGSNPVLCHPTHTPYFDRITTKQPLTFMRPKGCRASQAIAGARPDCSSAWMREFGPARDGREAQGTLRYAGQPSDANGFGHFCRNKSGPPQAEAVAFHKYRYFILPYCFSHLGRNKCKPPQAEAVAFGMPRSHPAPSFSTNGRLPTRQ